MADIWLTGCGGMLGSEVGEHLREKGISHFGTDREVDIADLPALEAFARGKSFGWVVNCAAYTAVDRAEDERDLAFRINAEGVKNLADVAGRAGARLVHISTDYVFDGEKLGAYTEEDAAAPLGAYGASKLEGERLLARAFDLRFVLRTAWLYGRNGPNFVHTMLRLFRERPLVKVVDDQSGSPTFAKDLARAIVRVVESGIDSYGVYHFTNLGVTTWYGFARAVHEGARRRGMLERDVEIVPIRTEEYPTKARRPKNSVLSKEKFTVTFGMSIRTWEAALDSFLDYLAETGG